MDTLSAFRHIPPAPNRLTKPTAAACRRAMPLLRGFGEASKSSKDMRAANVFDSVSNVARYAPKRHGYHGYHGYHWIIFDIEHTSLQSSYGTGMTKGYKRHEGRRVDEFVSTCLRNASCKTLKESPIYLNMNNKITVP